MNTEQAEVALKALVATINATGGLIVNDAGETAPAADEDWIDLGLAYLAACEALGVEPWNVERDLLDAQFTCPDPAGPDCHDDRCSLHYGDMGGNDLTDDGGQSS